MDVQIKMGAIQAQPAELIVVNLFQGVAQPGGATGAVDAALGGAIAELISAGDFKGKVGESALLYTRGAIPAARVLVAGLGEPGKFSADVARRVAGETARRVRELGVRRYASVVHGAGAGGLDVATAAQALVEGTVLGGYRFEPHKTESASKTPDLEALTVVEFDAAQAEAVRQGARAGRIVAEAVCLARDLVNEPGNYMTPSLLAEKAEEVANGAGLTIEVLGESEMAELGMGALLGVAQGSAEPARLITLQYNAQRTDLPAYVVVGKGITFDSGGISLKPAEHMELMKDDMSGAATTLAVLRAVAELQLPLRVIGLLPATENLPGGRAYKPGDVLESMSGLTIEVISTDAEGRLVLADALCLARRYAPTAVVDLATLTGACVVALGGITTGLMGNDAALAAELKDASAASGEKVWELPLYEEYAEQIDSDVADVKNSGGRGAGAITAGLFLSKFAQGYPWVHLDIAGTSWAEATRGYTVKGATGAGVRLLVEWLRARS